MCGSLLPKANGGGDWGVYAHSKRAMPRILCSVFTVTRWQGDTSFSTFRLARGQAGKIRPKVPACPRESKSSEITVTSVTLSPWSRLLTMQKSVTCDTKVSYLRYESLLLAIRKSVTCDTKVSYLRPVIHWLTTRITSVNSFKIKQAMEILASGRREWWGYSHHRNQWYASSMWNQPLGRAIL